MAFHASHVVEGTSLPKRAAGISRTAHSALICATESLDLAAAARLRRRVASIVLNCRWLILDLRKAEFIDSSGVRMLIELAGTLERKGAELQLVIPEGSRIERTLRLLKLDDRFRIFNRLEDAWVAQSLTVGIEH